jgi:plastocyanin
MSTGGDWGGAAIVPAPRRAASAALLGPGAGARQPCVLGLTHTGRKRLQASSHWRAMVLVVGLGLGACSPTRAPGVAAQPGSAASPSAAVSRATPAPSQTSALAVAVPKLSPSPAGALASSAAASGGPEVSIVEPPFRPPQEWTYAPTALTVNVGSSVTWTNAGAVAHTVTADDGTSFDSGTIDPKAAFRLTVTSAGTFSYHCSLHPWMTGALTVAP